MSSESCSSAFIQSIRFWQMLSFIRRWSERPLPVLHSCFTSTGSGSEPVWSMINDRSVWCLPSRPCTWEVVFSSWQWLFVLSAWKWVTVSTERCTDPLKDCSRATGMSYSVLSEERLINSTSLCLKYNINILESAYTPLRAYEFSFMLVASCFKAHLLFYYLLVMLLKYNICGRSVCCHFWFDKFNY